MLCQNFNFDGFSGTQIWSPQENDHNSRNIEPTNFFRLPVDPQQPPRQLCCRRVGKQNTVHSCFRQKTRWAPVCVAGFCRVWLLRSAGLDFLKSWDYSLCKCGHFKKKMGVFYLLRELRRLEWSAVGVLARALYCILYIQCWALHSARLSLPLRLPNFVYVS